ncbi:universal stress protein [Paractinoplanes hotanensis]|uniref:universal stress protein n=1 Tax=Paractinoplanes hotanensis TaxID=2906497 RepID=UPI0034DACFFC
MIARILLAADDSPAALAAARLCVELAGHCGASVRTVVVRTGRETEPAGEPTGDPVLRYVRHLADSTSVPFEGIVVSGSVVPSILEQARAYAADLIVVGRSDIRGTGRPYVGHHTRHMLEFADQPVVVVPYTAPCRASCAPDGGGS